MKIERYRDRQSRIEWEPKSRGYCAVCLRTPLTCYCSYVKSFDPKIHFVILIHGREAQKKIATGRLAHHCLQNSSLIPGYDYSANARVNAILADKNLFPVVLYPGDGSTNLNEISPANRAALFPAEKQLVIFVIDGTWITARKTMQRSSNLAALPRICFAPTAPSRFRVRQQPEENCFSTIEAIHQTIELLGDSRGFDVASRQHDCMLTVFDQMVDQQIALAGQTKIFCQWSPRKARGKSSRQLGPS